MAYSKEYLLEQLKLLLDKYGKIQTKLIDKEPNFPSRHAFVRVFGSIEKACEEIGYYKYQKGTFDISDAQKILDERNGHFILLNFNGMRNKCLVQCKECGIIEEIAPDSLLRNKTDEYFGCRSCNNKKCKNAHAISIVQSAPVKLTLEEIHTKYPRKDGYGYVYEVFNLVNNKRYIGSTIDPVKRWKEHIWAAFSESDLSYNYPLQSAIRKYNVDNFVFHILCEDVLLNDLANKEREMILKYHTYGSGRHGYNQTLETECALRDNTIKPKGTKCALIDNNGSIVIQFESYHDAARKLFNNEECATQICAVCNGRRQKYHKMKFIKLEGDD